MRKSRAKRITAEKWVIDEEATAKLHAQVDLSIIRNSLTASYVPWKAKPQFRNLEKKHLNAICGAIMVKRKNLNANGRDSADLKPSTMM